jgi:small subunit ribosomal protein S6
MRLYDIVVLVTPDLTDEEALKTLGDYRKILADGGAEFIKDEAWGRRRLAFPILRKRDAFYHHFQVKAEPTLVAETERRLRLSDQVLRHLAVRADEELKRSAKMAVRIAAKTARRPPRPAASVEASSSARASEDRTAGRPAEPASEAEIGEPERSEA